MSSAKVIFTYKRKRLSSHTGVGHADDCAEFSLDFQVDKHQDAPIEKLKSSDKNVMIFKCANCNAAGCSMNCRSCLEPFDYQCTGFQHQHVVCDEKVEVTCPSLPLHSSGRLGEKQDVQTSDTTNSREMVFGSHDLPVDNVSGEPFFGETTSSIEKDSCLLHSSYQGIGGCMQGGSGFQSVEKDSVSLHQQSYLGKTEVAKGKSSAPLRTFSRRLKRKADACDTGMFMDQPLRGGNAAIKECDFGPVTSCTCEVASKDNRLDAKCVDIKVESSDADKKSTFCQTSEKMGASEMGDPSSSYRRPCAETLILRHTEGPSNIQEELVVGTSPATRTSGLVASDFHYPDAVGSSSLQKDDIRVPPLADSLHSPCDGTVVSPSALACKTDEQLVSQQLRASSTDSQLTSSDSSDWKTGAAKRVELRACSNSLDLSRPPSGAFVIDCNVVPVSDVHEEASDIIQDSLMAKNSEKGKGLDLFGGNGQDSLHGVNTSSIKTEGEPKTKYLQLFAEDGKCGQCTPSHTHSDIGHSRGQQNAPFIVESQRHQLEPSSSKASAILGLSLPTGPIYEGQTSKDDSTTIHQSQNPNVRTCDLIQNPSIQPFSDQASFRHKLLLESINTRATSLRGNRNISLDKLEPCLAVWSEEELDSLWIGIRRHGKGNWHAILLDPRLRFAPWRVVGDLENQWEREQRKLFSGKHKPSSRHNLKPQDAHLLHCNGPVICHGIDDKRGNVTAETQLSLGDVYAQKHGTSFRYNAQNFGITQAQRLVTMTGSSAANYACGSYHNVQASVMISNEASPNGSAIAFGMNNCLPHWLRDQASTPSRLPDPLLHRISTPPQMGGLGLVHAFPEPSGKSCQGKNLMNAKLAGLNLPSCVHYGSPLIRKPDATDSPIVINSDASSEETISDDHNIRS